MGVSPNCNAVAAGLRHGLVKGCAYCTTTQARAAFMTCHTLGRQVPAHSEMFASGHRVS